MKNLSEVIKYTETLAQTIKDHFIFVTSFGETKIAAVLISENNESMDMLVRTCKDNRDAEAIELGRTIRDGRWDLHLPYPLIYTRNKSAAKYEYTKWIELC